MSVQPRWPLAALVALALAGELPDDARTGERPQPSSSASTAMRLQRQADRNPDRRVELAQADESGSDDRPGLLPFLREQVRNRRNPYPGEEGKNHTVVKGAFREIVAPVQKSTVEILCDGKRRALGIAVRRDGYVVSKASELEGRITCRLHAEREADGRIVGRDDANDLALLKFEGVELTPVRWSTDPVPPVGSILATVGRSEETIAIGVISTAPRRIPAPGGMLGIAVGQADDGPRVEQVLDESAAAKAGLQVNDVIKTINNREVRTRESLIETVGTFHPGERVRLRIVRGESELELATTLGNRSLNSRREFQNRLGGELSTRRGGFEEVLQHDTVLRPRDCGGPIVDLDGRVVGMNIARAERVASFALPAKVVQASVERLLPAAAPVASRAADRVPSSSAVPSPSAVKPRTAAKPVTP